MPTLRSARDRIGAAFLPLLLAATSPAPRLPADVAQVLDRREQCDHWAGEEPYDKARARQIATAIRDLGCDHIERDEAALRKRHSGNARIMAALDARE